MFHLRPHHITVIVVVLLFSGARSSVAQHLGTTRWNTILQGQGLLTSEPHDIVRMSDGSIVVSSQEGIQLKSSHNSSSDIWLDMSNSILNSDWILRLVKLSDEFAYVTTGPGDTYLLTSKSGRLQHVDTESLKCKTPESTSAPSEFQQHNGSEVLWSSSESLWLMPEPGSNCISFSNLPEEYGGWVSTYTRDAGGWWIGTRKNGLWRLETSVNEPAVVTRSFKVHVPGDRIRTLWRDQDHLWIGTSGAGLLRYDPESNLSTSYNVYNSGSTKISGSIVSGFAQFSDSTYLVATRTGLDQINPISGETSPFRFRPKGGSGSVRPEISFLYLDEWETIWVGHDGGISFTSASSLLTSTIELDSSNATGPVSAVFYNPGDRRLWIGANGHVLSTRINGSDQRIEMDVGKVTGFVANNTVTDIVPLEDQVFVATGSHGLIHRGANGTWVSNRPRDSAAVPGMPEWNALRDMEVNQDHLLLATVGAGLVRWPLTPIGEPDFISGPVDNITSLASGPGRKILAGSLNLGAYWHTQDSPELKKALPWKNVDARIQAGIVHDVAATNDGQYLAGTSGGLVYWSEDDTTWNSWSTSDGLPADLINNVVVDDLGTVWFSTEKAVCHWIRRNGKPKCLGVIDPLSTELIQPTSMAVVGDRAIVGTSSSVRLIPQRLFSQSMLPPAKPFVLNLETDTGEFSTFDHTGGHSILSPHARLVRLQAELASFADAHDVRMIYQLRGETAQAEVSQGTTLDAAFHELSHRSEPYFLDVDVWTNTGRLYSTSLSFTLPLPFWKTLWFLVSSLTILSTVVSWQAAEWVRRRRRDARELQLALASGREQERANLSRQIHDLSLQNLYVIKQQMNRLGIDEDSASYQQMTRSIDESINELRRLCGELLPISLGSFGLETAVRSFLQGIETANPDLEVILESSIDEEPDTESALAIFRALQTSVANVIRHANASRLEIIIDSNPHSSTVKVMDDGSGFIVPSSLITLARNRHYGLLGLHELAKQYTGEFQVDSAPGKGTRILFSIANRVAS